MNKKAVQPGVSRKQRGIYLLPNLLTTAALFAGFYAIIAAMKGYYEAGSIAIFVAMIADGLDGRVARLTHTQSNFGAQYDSLSDMSAFGTAPAILLFSWSLHAWGKVGWLLAFLFTAATALRLARFNTQQIDKKHFQGLPSPAAAGVIASGVWLMDGFGLNPLSLLIPSSILAFLVASLMVSTIRYTSFKDIDFKGRVPFFTIVVTVVVLAAIALNPPEMLFLLFFGYMLSGPIMTLITIRKIRKQRRLAFGKIRS